MRKRCLSPNNAKYRRYGGRGITIDPRWDHFAVFRDWAKTNGYARDLTINRVDNDGPYSPENCCWATPKQQARNTKRNRLITWLGETKCAAEWGEDPRCPVS
jgi:hypothetical protein